MKRTINLSPAESEGLAAIHEQLRHADEVIRQIQTRAARALEGAFSLRGLPIPKAQPTLAFGDPSTLSWDEPEEPPPAPAAAPAPVPPTSDPILAATAAPEA